MSFDGDVAVVGVGSVGSMALWRLALRGLKVHGFEQFGVGHDRSAAGGETRMFRTNSLKHAKYVALAQASHTLWRDLEAASGHQLLHLCGELVFGAPDAPGLLKAREHAKQYGLRCEALDIDDVQRRYPQHRLRANDEFLLDRDAGYLRSDLAVTAAAHVAERHGAVVHQYVGVDSLEPDADGVTLFAGGQSRRFRKVIVSAGPWTTRLLPTLEGLIRVRRPVQAWFAAREPGAFGADRFAGFLRTGVDSYYGFPTIDGATIKLGLSSDFNKVVEDQDQLERRVTVEEVQRFREVVAEFFDGLYPEPVRVGAWMEGYTMDNQAMVGPLPDAPSVIVLSGFSGHGFKFASLMGEVAAELATSGETRLDLEFMSPARQLEPWPKVVPA